MRMYLAIIEKDIKGIFTSPQVYLPLLILPVLMMIILPVALIVGAAYGDNIINGADKLIGMLEATRHYKNEGEMLLDMGINYMFPGFYLLIPMMTASIIAANSFISEKEYKTFEALMYTPLNVRDLFVSKVLGASIIAYGLALLSAVLFGLVVDIGGMMLFGQWLFPNLKWLIMIFWVSPAIIVFCVSFMVLVSARANTFQEAQQMAGFLVLPALLLILGQSSGLFILQAWMLALLGLLVIVLDIFMLKNAMDRYTPEKLL